MDDILIFSKDLEEHRILVKKVLQRLQEEGSIFLKPEKCFFEKPSIEYLGMIISQNKIPDGSRQTFGSTRMAHS